MYSERLVQCPPIVFGDDAGTSSDALASRPLWLLRTSSVASATEELIPSFRFILINCSLNVNGHMYLLAAIPGSEGVVCARYNMQEKE